jgi:hypothetical protein
MLQGARCFEFAFVAQVGEYSMLILDAEAPQIDLSVTISKSGT